MSHFENKKRGSFELVLGAGGIKGFGHIGVLKSIEKRNLQLSKVTGVSVGSLIAAFYCNGFAAREISAILFAENFRSQGAGTLSNWQKALSIQALQAAGLKNLLPIMDKLVEKYQLKPKPSLQILAYDLRSLEPVLFRSGKYDLAKALAASCAVPLLFCPVFDQKHNEKQVLMDGFLHHPHPDDFCRGPAIISKLGFAGKLPRERLPASQMLLHFAELANSPFLNCFFPDPAPGKILIESGMPDVATLSFSSSARTCRAMVAYGERQAELSFKRAAAAGKVVF